MDKARGRRKRTRVLENDIRASWARRLQIDESPEVLHKSALGDEAVGSRQDGLLTTIQEKHDRSWQLKLRILDKCPGNFQRNTHT